MTASGRNDLLCGRPELASGRELSEVRGTVGATHPWRRPPGGPAGPSAAREGRAGPRGRPGGGVRGPVAIGDAEPDRAAEAPKRRSAAPA